MLLHIATHYKSGSTLLADIWFSFNMTFLLHLSLMFFFKYSSLHHAVKMLLTNMFSNMFLQVTPLDISCPTLLANKTFSFAMCYNMCLQMFSLWKSFTTYFAAIWVFSNMSTCMFLTNPLPHVMHINGFPPACFHLCHLSQLFCIFLPRTPCSQMASHTYVSELLKVNDVVAHVCAKLSRICAKLLFLNAKQ